jgi:hypothetical protein
MDCVGRSLRTGDVGAAALATAPSLAELATFLAQLDPDVRTETTTPPEGAELYGSDI